MGRYIHVVEINPEPCVLKHKYHRHWNHGRPRVVFGGILGSRQLSPFGGGGPARGLYRPPSGNENPASIRGTDVRVLLSMGQQLSQSAPHGAQAFTVRPSVGQRRS